MQRRLEIYQIVIWSIRYISEVRMHVVIIAICNWAPASKGRVLFCRGQYYWPHCSNAIKIIIKRCTLYVKMLSFSLDYQPLLRYPSFPTELFLVYLFFSNVGVIFRAVSREQARTRLRTNTQGTLEGGRPPECSGSWAGWGGLGCCSALRRRWWNTAVPAPGTPTEPARTRCSAGPAVSRCSAWWALGWCRCPWYNNNNSNNKRHDGGRLEISNELQTTAGIAVTHGLTCKRSPRLKTSACYQLLAFACNFQETKTKKKRKEKKPPELLLQVQWVKLVLAHIGIESGKCLFLPKAMPHNDVRRCRFSATVFLHAVTPMLSQRLLHKMTNSRRFACLHVRYRRYTYPRHSQTPYFCPRPFPSPFPSLLPLSLLPLPPPPFPYSYPSSFPCPSSLAFPSSPCPCVPHLIVVLADREQRGPVVHHRSLPVVALVRAHVPVSVVLRQVVGQLVGTRDLPEHRLVISQLEGVPGWGAQTWPSFDQGINPPKPSAIPNPR